MSSEQATAPTITCPDCNGEKQRPGLFPIYADGVPKSDRKPFIVFDCDRCDGSGVVPESMLQWKRDGARLKQSRLDSGWGLREFCVKNGIEPLHRSRRERGIIDPATPDVPYLWID